MPLPHFFCPPVVLVGEEWDTVCVKRQNSSSRSKLSHQGMGIICSLIFSPRLPLPPRFYSSYFGARSSAWLNKGIHYCSTDTNKKEQRNGKWVRERWWWWWQHEHIHLWEYSWAIITRTDPSLVPFLGCSPCLVEELWPPAGLSHALAHFVCLHLVFPAWTLLTFILELKVLEVHLSQQAGTFHSKQNVSFFFGLKFLFSNTCFSQSSLCPSGYYITFLLAISFVIILCLHSVWN